MMQIMTLRFLNKTLPIFGALYALACMLPGVAHAQSSQSFSLSPTIFNVEAQPGQEWQTELRLINSNSFPLELSVAVQNFSPGPDGATPQFMDPDVDDQSLFANWIETDTSIIVPPEQTYELPIQVSVPADAEPGGHFAALLVSTNSANSGGTSVGTAQAISSLLFLRVAGDVSEIASIRSFRTTDYLVANPEATVELRVKNSGNVHIQPQGEIVLYNMWGQERGIIPINKQSAFGNVLPDSIRTYRFTWTGEWSITDIGRYTVEAALVYGSTGKKTIYDQTYFWFIPIQWLLLVVLFIVGFILLLRWAIRAYINHMFTIAGIDPAHPDTEPRTIDAVPESEAVTSKKVSVIAPLEEGLLDLRGNLKMAAAHEETKLAVLTAFIVRYKLFFLAVAAIIGALAIIIWFVTAAMSPERDFVITSDDGRETTAEQARATRNPISDAQTGALEGQFLTLINRSGDQVAEDRVRRLLDGGNQVITASDFDPNITESRTVIVYPVSETERALVLSKILNEAPISALSDSETRSREIIIYIGSDAVNW
jgi:hypothetical protein